MIKKIVLISLSTLLVAYILFAVFVLNPKAGNEICKNMEIVVTDTVNRHFITSTEIAFILKKADISPIGKKMQDIDPNEIENILEKNKLIKKAECYKTTDAIIKIEIYQKIPILRVINNKGENYYIDLDGEIMPLVQGFAAHVPVANGYIENEYAKTNLYNFALFLQENEFWNAQIEQIYVNADSDVEITPRIGNHQIILGKIDDFEEKLDKLKLFYDKGLSQVGWNKYSHINLKYKNQVVCTKNNKE